MRPSLRSAWGLASEDNIARTRVLLLAQIEAAKKSKRIKMVAGGRGLLHEYMGHETSFTEVFSRTHPGPPPTSPQANPCVPHACGAWKGIPEPL